jgi:hypothetical protein
MKPSRRVVSPLRIGIIASLILAVLHIILLGGTSQRRAATRQLEKEYQVLQENYEQLEKVNQEQLDQLRLEQHQIQDEVAELEASFPELGAPFALFRRGLELARDSQVDLRAISRMDSSYLETTSGEIIREEFDLELGGSLQNCIAFIGAVENAGRDTIVMQYASFWPEEGRCSLELITRGLTPTAGE